MNLEALRLVVIDVRIAHEDVSRACSTLLAYERSLAPIEFERLHAAVRDLGGALQRATLAQRELAALLALDPERLNGDLDSLVPPLLEGSFQEE